MSYLQLAENDPYNRLAEGNPLKNYIFIPAGMLGMSSDTYVREDFFDGLNADDYKKTITMLAPYQNTGMNGILDTAVSFIPGVGPVAAGGLNIAKKLIAKRQERVAAGTAKPLFKAGGKISNLIGKLKGMKNQAASDQNTMPTKGEPIQPEPQTKDFPIAGNLQFGNPPQEESFFQKYKTPLLIGGGVLVAGGLYLALRKKKRR